MRKKELFVPVVIGPLLVILLFLTTAATNQPDAGDIDPPHLVSLAIEPSVIDTTKGPAVIYVTLHITDDLSGAGIFRGVSQMRFQSYHAQDAYAYFNPNYTLISGTVNNGIFQAAIPIPQYSETGEWSIAYLYLVDGIGNDTSFNHWTLDHLGFPYSFTNTDSYTPTVTPTPEFPPTAPFVPTVPAKITPTPQNTYFAIIGK